LPVSLRCFIVDDNQAFLAAARHLLEGEGASVVGVASTSAEALRGVAVVSPDVTLVDVNLGEESGVDLACSLATGADGARSRVILISTYAAADLVDVLPERPTIVFLSKTDLSARAIRSALGLPPDTDAPS
jgi:DNA-binding NarL/FixJ family response regulator